MTRQDTQPMPPQDLEAERATLGSMMQNGGVIPHVLAVIPLDCARWFFGGGHAAIFAALVELHKQHTPIDLVTVRDKMTRHGTLEDAGGVGYLIQCAASVGSSVRAEHYARIVRDKGILRDAIQFAHNLKTEAFDEAEDAGALLERAEKSLRKIAAQVREDFAEAAADPRKPFPLAALPDRVREFVEAVSACTGTDPSYGALAALVVLAGCVGNRAEALVKNGYVEPSVLWGILVGKSGTLKSPVFRIITRPLLELYKRDRADFEDRQEDYGVEMQRYAVDLAAWKASQKKQVSDPPIEPQQPTEKRIMVADVTVEKLSVLLDENPLGLLCCRDELSSWIGAFDRYAGGGKGSDRPAWLSMHDAASVTVDRQSKSKTTFVDRAAASVLGGIQPNILRRVFGATERECGLLARCLVCYPPDVPSKWTEDDLSHELTERWQTLIEALLSVEPGRDGAGYIRPHQIPLSPDAKPIFIDWHDQHMTELADEPDDDLRAALSKLKGACVRFSLIIELVGVATSGSGSSAISADSMRRAIRLAEWFKHESRRVHALFGESEESGARRRLVEWIERKGGSCTVRELSHGPREWRSTADDARERLNELEAAGLGTWEYLTAGPGRPSPRFVLNQSGTAGTGTETPSDAPNATGSSATIPTP